MSKFLNALIVSAGVAAAGLTAGCEQQELTADQCDSTLPHSRPVEGACLHEDQETLEGFQATFGGGVQRVMKGDVPVWMVSTPNSR